MITVFCKFAYTVEVERFEHYNTEDGLSQNAAVSIFCDSEGYLWVGTWNGLNRYDGYQFRVFDVQDGISNNHIVSIKEDGQGFIWIQTYDGYINYFNKETEKFTTLPFHHKKQRRKKTVPTLAFYQFDKNLIWLGSSSSGLYQLAYDNNVHDYKINQYLSRGSSTITNNHVSCITADTLGNTWVGTPNGLNQIRFTENRDEAPKITHHFVNISFTASITTNNFVLFGTDQDGLIKYEYATGSFKRILVPNKLSKTGISIFQVLQDGKILIGTADEGCFLYSPTDDLFEEIKTLNPTIKAFYPDRNNNVWILSNSYGVERYNPTDGAIKHYYLAPKKIQSLISDERVRFFEDHQNNLWISSQGGGLGIYDQLRDTIHFYRNDPNDPNSIGSDYIHQVIEDKSHNIWVGTSRSSSGLNRIIFKNPAFQNIIPQKNYSYLTDNVVRALHEDHQGNIWAATKSGKVFIYDINLKLKNTISISASKSGDENNNVYAIFEDPDGYVWLGTKGGGLFITKNPIYDYNNYSAIAFVQYKHEEDQNNSIDDNRIYSIAKDHLERVWVGTFGNGINITKNKYPEKLEFLSVNTQNSNLSSDFIRKFMFDSKGNLWVSTIFGLNLLTKEQIENNDFNFKVFLSDAANPNSVSYNDIVHIFEDSNNTIWLTTFGGGVNKVIENQDGSYSFERFGSNDGLSSPIVHGVLEDNNHNLWFSAENHLNLYIKENNRFEVFFEQQVSQSNNYSENTCLKLSNGKLVFGSFDGFVVIDIDKISKQETYQNPCFRQFYDFKQKSRNWC